MAKIITAFPINNPNASGHSILEGVTEAGHILCANIDERGEHAVNPGKHMHDAIEKHNPDLVIVTKAPFYSRALKAAKCKTALMNVDCRRSINDWSMLFPTISVIDGLFICEYHLIPEYEKRFGKKIHFLPTACGSINKRISESEITERDREKYTADISFIGSRDMHFHGEPRRRIIDAIEKKYGDRFKWYGPESPNGYAGNREFNLICSLSKIMIGNNYTSSFDSYVSRRDFLIIGAGGFLLTDLTKNTMRIMEDGKHFVSYDGPEDCLNKIEHYLNDEESRQRIADEAYKYAHSHCRWKNRIETICKKLGVK